MDKLYSIEQYYMLRQLEERAGTEPTTARFEVEGKPYSIQSPPLWDFYIAFADYAHEHELFQSLMDDELIEPMLSSPPRIHDDWRRHFPEHRYRFTELGRDVVQNPGKWVEWLDIRFGLRDAPYIPPELE